MGPALEGIKRRGNGPMVAPKLSSVTNEPKTWDEQYFRTGHPKTSCFYLQTCIKLHIYVYCLNYVFYGSHCNEESFGYRGFQGFWPTGR